MRATLAFNGLIQILRLMAMKHGEIPKNKTTRLSLIQDILVT